MCVCVCVGGGGGGEKSGQFLSIKKKIQIGPGSIFCVFASVARILKGKDDENEKRICNFRTQCARTFTEQLTSNTVSEQIFLAL